MAATYPGFGGFSYGKAWPAGEWLYILSDITGNVVALLFPIQ